MTESDEIELSSRLTERCADIRFIDDNVWPSEQPPVQRNISLCKTRFCFLWSPILIPELPTIRRKDGMFEGPTVGPVIQFIRCQKTNNLLLSGSVAQGIQPLHPNYKAIKAFSSMIWKTLRSFGSTDIGAVDPNSRKLLTQDFGTEFLIFPDAIRWCKENTTRLLRHTGANVFYLPLNESNA